MKFDIEVLAPKKEIEFEDIYTGSIFKIGNKVNKTVIIAIKTSMTGFYDLTNQTNHGSIDRYKETHRLFRFYLIPEGTKVTLTVVN